MSAEKYLFLNNQENEILSMLKIDPGKAISLMYDNYYRYLVSVTYRIIKDEDGTQDIIQSVLIDIWKKKETLKINSSLIQYLRRAAINKALNHLRAKKQIYEDSEELENLNLSNDYDQSYDLEAQELRVKIDYAIENLPERCRLVFVLSRFEEMTYKQIGEKLNISHKTVENQMIKALRVLRNKIYENNK